MVDGHYRRRRHAAALVVLAAIFPACGVRAFAQPADSSTRRRSGDPPHSLLAIGDASTSVRQHDSISHALSVIEALGLRANLFATMIRTDTQLVTKGAIAAATGTLTYYQNLDDFDAVLLFVEGDPPLTRQQKSDLIAFVRSGKGLIAIHTTVGAFDSWPEFRNLLGIRGSKLDAIEKPDEVTSPGVSRFFPEPFHLRDWIVPLTLKPGTHLLASSNGSPAVWTTTYARGRVFVSQLGHDDQTWDRQDVQQMMLEGVRWAMEDGKRRGAKTPL
ncbi:MAG TPA: ThuA domain-containing protein [Bryobacteraceae bacterium]|nr:ThuA domain-containing protein [Bryobacteraceae bacterium]